MRQSFRALRLFPILSVFAFQLLAPVAVQAQDLDDAEKQRAIETLSAELRLFITQNRFQEALDKAAQLETLDPQNASAKVWKEYASRQMSGPQESRLEKLLGVAISKEEVIAPAADEPGLSSTPAETVVAANVEPLPTTTEPGATPQPADTSSQTTPPVASTPADPQTPAAAQTPAPEPVAPTPSQATPPAPAPVSASSSGSNLWMYVVIGVVLAVVIVLVGYFMTRKKGEAKAAAPAKSSAPAKAPVSTARMAAAPSPITKVGATKGTAVHDAITQVPNDQKTGQEESRTKPDSYKDESFSLQAPTFGSSDPITSYGNDSKTNSDMPTRDLQTRGDQVTRDQNTQNDPISFAEGDDALYQSLAEDDLPETLVLNKPKMNDSNLEGDQDPEALTLGGIALDTNEETKAPARASAKDDIEESTAEMSFGSIMFNDEGETKGTSKPTQAAPSRERDEDDYNDASFNSMMFGGSTETKSPAQKKREESRQGLPPSKREDSKQGLPGGKKEESRQGLPQAKKEDSKQGLPDKQTQRMVVKNEEEGEQTYSSLMFDGEETVAPGFASQKMTKEKPTAERSFDEVMLDAGEETVAPGFDIEDLKDTKPLPGMEDTKKLADSRQKPDLSKADTKPLDKEAAESPGGDDDDVIKL
ncbi:MAG: hypothetical protein SFY68_00025 [Candidatus Sumerlaeia bacterium]|nr:hypothetical protein [Candidatus Sumerlaeia bacterium]